MLVCFPLLTGLAFNNKTEKKKCNILVITVFYLIFLFLLVCRDLNIGNDTYGYKTYYDAARNMSWNKIFILDAEWEHGYLILQKILSGLSVNFRWFLLLVSSFAIFPIWDFYKKESEIPILTIALFLAVSPFSMYFSGMRQIIAMAFAIPAFNYSRNKRPIMFLLMVFLAFMFHRSAFILLPMYPMCNVNITGRRIWFAVPFIGVVLIFNEQIFSFLVKFISDMYVGEIEQTGAYTVLMLLVVFVICCYIVPVEESLDKDTKALRNLLLLSVCLQCFASVNPLAMRLNYYYLIFIPVLMPKIAINRKPALKYIIDTAVLGISAFFVLYFYYNLIHGESLNIYPYVFFWR